MKTFITARVTVPGLHHWPDAPEPFWPLRTPHRHLFTFEVEVETDHADRATEFLYMGTMVENYLRRDFPAVVTVAWGGHLDFGANSCEALAQRVLETFAGARRVTVWEDMENAGGAER